jgi:hypothetical protein
MGVRHPIQRKSYEVSKSKKLVRPDLVDNCPSCGADFQVPPIRKKGPDGKFELYDKTPVMDSGGRLACMICEVHEGREIVQEGYYDRGLFKNTYVPPTYGSRIWVLRRQL